MSSWKKPTNVAIEQTLRLLTRRQHRRYFFERLKNPLWIRPLLDAREFSSPPGAIEDPETGNISFPPYPESRYLARVASEAPEDAVAAIEAMPSPDPANPSVLSDWIAVAGAAPPILAARLMPKILAAYQKPFAPGIVSDDLAELAVHLSQDASDAAISAMEALLHVDFPAPESASPHLARQGQPRYHVWNYHRFLQDLVKTAPSLGSRLLEVLLRQLRRWVEAGLTKRDEGLRDSSNLWIHRLDSLNPEQHVDEALVDAVLSAGRLAVESGSVPLTSAVSLIRRHPRSLFQRMALHLLSAIEPFDVDVGRQLVLDRQLFDLPEATREYSRLLEVAFPHLSEDSQQEILAWIAEGPPIEAWKADFHRYRAADLDEDDLRDRIDRWLYRRLHPIRDHFPKSLHGRFEALAAKYEEWRAAEEAGPTFEIIAGAESPVSSEQLVQMDDRQLLDFLSTWPRQDADADGRYALGQSLSAAVKQTPARFAGLSIEFRGLDTTIVRSLLDGLDQSLRSGGWFAWGPVVQLCGWVVGQPRDERTHESAPYDFDPTWASVRLSVARLLREGVSAKGGEIPQHHRSALAEILRILSDDDDPSYSEPDAESLDPATYSLNCIRGVAIHAAVAFALWVRRSVIGPREEGAFSLHGDPELRELLERRIDPSRDPHPAIRSAFGRWFPWFVLFDRDWAATVKTMVFPHPPKTWRPAWSSYITLCNPYDDVFPVLADEYSRGVSVIGTWEEERFPSFEDERLGQHVIVFFVRGVIDLDHELLISFFARAGPGLAKRTIWFCGQLLQRPKDAPRVPANVTERLKQLWEWRRELVQHSEYPNQFSGEMGMFGYWFAHGTLDDDWCIVELDHASAIADKVEMASEVVARLAALADAYPAHCLRILERVAAGDEWNRLERDRNVLEIIARARDAGEPELARESASRLARERGWMHLSVLFDGHGGG